MVTTLGKRIMAERKKLGLTQDKLAETLGVTAQAVSKWENDQSCPDITMLPRLSKLFGITVDELLGVAKTESPETAVLEGIVEDSKVDEDGRGFEFNFKPGRRDGIFMALFILVVGALTLISVLFNLGISFWSILWPCAILAVGVRGFIRKFSFFSVVCTLFGSYFLLENMYVTNLNISWKLVFPVLILLLGITLLVDSFKQPKHSRWNIHRGRSKRSAGSPEGTPKNDFSVDGDSFTCNLAFGENYRSISMEKLTCGEISCSFGELTVDLSNCEEFAKNCHIAASCSFGELELRIPKSVRVEPNGHTAFAGIEIEGIPDVDATSVMTLDANVNFGQITVRYI